MFLESWAPVSSMYNKDRLEYQTQLKRLGNVRYQILSDRAPRSWNVLLMERIATESRSSNDTAVHGTAEMTEQERTSYSTPDLDW